ncbi:TIM barrel protein, partial [Roseisolibacter sp. H3M3-2]|uniref:hydroxypyruvate isomerase family protein n=1 Tax=Roseisolibacter sp. H3M3-2 TaxID=3031323 RepID=UPI0023DC5982
FGAGGSSLAALPAALRAEGAPPAGEAPLGGAMSYRHSVTRWPWSRLPLDELARAARGMGARSIELLEPSEFATVKAHGLACAVGYAPAGEASMRLTRGWNREAHHEWLLAGYVKGLELAAAAGVPQVICFSGNRDGLSDAAGLDACAKGLRQLMPHAERLGVTVIMELLNSKVDHKDYQCDRTPWGVALVDRVGSARFKLLYDVYHMQIMEGDVIRTIRDHRQHIGHYHVAGVPGRHEIDGSQELHYPAIVRALNEIGFDGYVAQEFIPTRDPLASLREAIRICTV